MHLAHSKSAAGRLLAFESGAWGIRQNLIRDLHRKKLGFTRGVTRHKDLREALMTAAYSLIREFTDESGMATLLAAQSRFPYSTGGRTGIDWHPFKLGLRVCLGATGRGELPWVLSPRIRTTWGDIFLVAHEFNVPGEDLIRFMNFGRIKPLNAEGAKRMLKPHYKCGVDELCGIDGCRQYGCKKLEKEWGVRHPFQSNSRSM